jgi:hypothetical protein
MFRKQLNFSQEFGNALPSGVGLHFGKRLWIKISATIIAKHNNCHENQSEALLLIFSHGEKRGQASLLSFFRRYRAHPLSFHQKASPVFPNLAIWKNLEIWSCLF